MDDILPGIDDSGELNSNTETCLSVNTTPSNSHGMNEMPLLATPRAQRPQAERLHFTVLKYRPDKQGTACYERLTEGNILPDATRTPPAQSIPKESVTGPPSVDPGPEIDVKEQNIKSLLLGFVQAFLTSIGFNEESSDSPKLLTTPIGSRIPYVPIDPSTGRKFRRMHPPPHQLLPVLSEQTIPCLTPEPAANQQSQTPTNLRPNSLVSSHISKEMKAELLQRAQQPIRFSESVQAQNDKSEKIYLHFCREMELTPYPLTTECLLAFLIWVAESHKYNAYSIDCILYSSLCRLNVVRSGLYIDPLSQYAARALIASFYRDPTLKPPRGGMHPIIPDDVARMISAMDFRNPLSFSLAALFTFALSTGARGNSCGNVHLADLGPFYESEDSYCILVVTLVKLKGRPLEKLQLSLAGRPDTKSPLDVIYWLNQHLLHNFAISLKDLVSKKGTESLKWDALLWPYKTDTMTQYLKLRLQAAGLPNTQFGFHSFRSGFLASCLIQGEKRGESISDVLVRCALITGWKALGSIEFSYIREAARRRILPTNMIGVTSADPFVLPSTLENGSCKDREKWDHANSFEFHGTVEQVTPGKQRSNLFQLKRYLEKSLWVEDATTAANQYYINSCYWWCIRECGKGLFERGEVTEEEKARFKRKSQLYSYLGYQYLDKETATHPESMEAVAAEMIIELRNRGKVKSVLSSSAKSIDRAATEAPRLFTQRRTGRCRVRLEWTKREDERLLSGIERGEWMDEILVDLPARNQDDIYFHVRNMNKKRVSQNLPPLVQPKRRSRGGGGGSGGGGGMGGVSETTGQETAESTPPSSESQSTDQETSESSSKSTPTQTSESSSETDSQPHRRPPPLPKRTHHSSSHTERCEGGKRRSS